MRTVQRSLTTAALSLVFAFSGVSAQDMTGTWILAVELDAGSGDATLVLVQEGTDITGSYSGALGEQDVTGTIEGDKVELGFDSEAGRIIYTGTLDGDSYEGTCEYGQLGAGTFAGSRSGFSLRGARVRRSR